MNDPKKFEQLKKISVLMDSRFQGPMGFKFGLDGLLGLIPFVGDFLTTAVSLYIIAQAAVLGCAPVILIRMGLNILIENILDMIPVVGSIFDFVWKANVKNIALLESHLLNPRGATFKSRFVLGLITFSILMILVGSFALTIIIIRKILEWIALASS